MTAPSATEHRWLGSRIAALAGEHGKAVAQEFRNTGVPLYDKGLIAAMGQPHHGWNSEADGVLWYLLRLFITGELIIGYMKLGDGPGGDMERERNQYYIRRSW